jgi:hypothetical protein
MRIALRSLRFACFSLAAMAVGSAFSSAKGVNLGFERCDSSSPMLQVVAADGAMMDFYFMNDKEGHGKKSCNAEKSRILGSSHKAMMICSCSDPYPQSIELKCAGLDETGKYSELFELQEVYRNDKSGWDTCEGRKSSFESGMTRPTPVPRLRYACDCNRSEDGQSVQCGDDYYEKRSSPVSKTMIKIFSPPRLENESDKKHSGAKRAE